MSVCQHRPEPGGLLVPCERREWIPDVGVQHHVCLCADEVKAELDAAKATPTETRTARLPDSAREERTTL